MEQKKKRWRLAIILSAVALVLLLAAVFVLPDFIGERADDLSKDEAQAFVNKAIDELPLTPEVTGIEFVNQYLAKESHVTVEDLSYGTARDVTLTCTYRTIDAEAVYLAHKDELFSIVLDGCKETDTSTKVMGRIRAKLLGYLKEEAKEVTGKIELTMYQTDNGWKLYHSDEFVNTCLAGVLDIRKDILATKTVMFHGEERDITSLENYRKGIAAAFELHNYDKVVPSTKGPVVRWFEDFGRDFYKNFIKDARWKYLATGLLTTLEITGLSVLIGVFIGFLVAMIRCTFLKTGKLRILDFFCRVYLTVVRGTPLMVQLLIIYFVIFLPIGIPKFISAVLCFGLNSGAYVAEIVRGGIMGVDVGQTEAGRSLGFNYMQTMFYIVIPQAFKSVLPSLTNEFIMLLKKSSVAFYIGVEDLTQGGIKIRSLTYSDFLPLIAVAVIYLIVVMFLSYLVSLLERRLRKSER